MLPWERSERRPRPCLLVPGVRSSVIDSSMHGCSWHRAWTRSTSSLREKLSPSCLALNLRLRIPEMAGTRYFSEIGQGRGDQRPVKEG
jgi:hypothetical protein